MNNLEEQLRLLRGQVCEGGVCHTTFADLFIDEATGRAYLRSKLLTESVAPVAVPTENCDCQIDEAALIDDALLDKLGAVLRESKKRVALEAFLNAIG